MITLALDTSAGMAASLVADDGTTLATDRVADDRHHAERLARLVSDVLASAQRFPGDVGAVVVGTGPAPFTGLRAGLVTARAFAFGRGLTAMGAPSFDAVARQALVALDLPVGRELLVLGDARRREVYWARYRVRELAAPGRSGGAGAAALDVELVAGPEVAAPASLLAAPEARDATVVASSEVPVAVAAGLVPQAVLPVDPAFLVAAVHARRAAGLDVGTDPLYLRRPDAHVPGPAKRAS